jgi:hypothetical protein
MVCVTSVTWFSGSLVFITPGRHFSDEPAFKAQKKPKKLISLIIVKEQKERLE